MNKISTPSIKLPGPPETLQSTLNVTESPLTPDCGVGCVRVVKFTAGLLAAAVWLATKVSPRILACITTFENFAIVATTVPETVWVVGVVNDVVEPVVN
jgi:hypothetical protein